MRPITATDLMNPNILAVPEAMPLGELATFLVDHSITGAPVKNPQGELVGVVSMVDLARYLANGEDDELCAADIMTRKIHSVDEESGVSEIAATLLNHHLHRLVVTRRGRPVGVLSTSDLLGLLIED